MVGTSRAGHGSARPAEDTVQMACTTGFAGSGPRVLCSQVSHLNTMVGIVGSPGSSVAASSPLPALRRGCGPPSSSLASTECTRPAATRACLQGDEGGHG